VNTAPQDAIHRPLRRDEQKDRYYRQRVSSGTAKNKPTACTAGNDFLTLTTAMFQ